MAFEEQATGGSDRDSLHKRTQRIAAYYDQSGNDPEYPTAVRLSDASKDYIMVSKIGQLNTNAY